MNVFSHCGIPRHLILVVMAVGVLTLCPMTMAAEAMTPENSHPGPVGVSVSGASAGITTDYFEQVVTDALAASNIFSGIDNSRKADVVMPMIGAKGVFPGTATSSDAPYLLNIRIIKVDTPSFSSRMTFSMNAVWSLYRNAGETELLHEKIHSTYTGGVFEGGIHGANRVRVAMEGATRENVRIGVEMLESLDLEQVSPDSEQE